MNEETKTITLPSGRSATLREAKVRDLLQAHRTTGFSSEPMIIATALIAEVIVLDGKRVVYEDVLELSAEDGLVLQSAVMEGERSANFPAAPGASSAAS
ncbi:MAG TPA: hypothetical protein VKS22_02015 [Candidatus Binataceae bacterium]|nr:hypothetical protein [Candidatus Binataceae bacterium]